MILWALHLYFAHFSIVNYTSIKNKNISNRGSCCCLVTNSYPTVCDPMDCSLPGSSVHGISQARILEWVAISFSRGFSWSRDQTQVPCTAGRFFYGQSHQGSLIIKGMSVKMLRLDSPGKENPTKFLSSILTWSILYPKKSDEAAESGRAYQKRWHFS